VDEQSIWKKEISFGRKKKAAAESTNADAPAEKPASIWKKEISFGRKKKAAEPVEPVEGAEPEAEESAPDEQVWTRAVSFGRKSAEAEPILEAVADESEVVADASGDVQVPDTEPGPAEPVAEEEQAWTKAVSFSRKSDTPELEPVEAIADESEVAADGSGDVQVPDPETGPAEPVAESDTPEPAPAVADEAETDNPGSDPETGPAEPVPVEAVADESEVVADGSGDAQVPDTEPGPAEPVAEEEQAWTKAVSFSRQSNATEPPATVDEPPAPVTEAPTETWSAVPTLPHAPEPVVVHPPVPASELAPESEPEQKVPFWKKEISFGSGKKREKTPAPAPAPEPEPETEPVVVHPPVPAAELPPEPMPAQKVPFWKKDLSLGGGKKREKAPKAAKTPKEPKPRNPKQPHQPKVKTPRGAKGAKRLVGLKIGASQLAAARVSNNGLAELLQVAREPLEPGIVVGGELRDPDALAEALKEFFAKHKLPKKGVRLGIANNRIGVRTFDIAGISDQKQLTNAIRFRAQEALPIPIDEAVLDYQVLGEAVDDEGRPTKRILLVVAYRDLIDRYVDACKKAGISLAGIDLEAFALLRALQAPQEGVGGDSSAALVAVAIGHDRSTFAVSDGRVCEFTRVLEWGGSALNVAIARVLDAAPSEVESVKRALALTDEMVPDGLTPEQAKNARDAMRRAIQTFARELVSSLQYYQNQPGSLGIGEIALTGGTAHLSGLAGELERLIGVRVRVGDPLARMKVSKRLGEAEQIGSLAVAIGLGIED
jgi:type IV pilus assembly protein PilM